VTAAECASHPVADREVVPNIGRPAAQAAGLLVMSGGVSVVRQRLLRCRLVPETTERRPPLVRRGASGRRVLSSLGVLGGRFYWGHGSSGLGTAHTFLRGHRIRLQVSGGAHPRYGRNLGTRRAVRDQHTLTGKRPHTTSRCPAPLCSVASFARLTSSVACRRVYPPYRWI
jgi:X-Pro dipeptidyl-peptidase C-terminal non-catalytic domain